MVVGIIDIAAAHRVQVRILQLLQHHGVVVDLLRMTPLLPDLVVALHLVPQLVIFELIEQAALAPAFQVVDDLAGGERFEVLHLAGQVGRGGDEMQVVLHDDVAVKGQPAVGLDGLL